MARRCTPAASRRPGSPGTCADVGGIGGAFRGVAVSAASSNVHSSQDSVQTQTPEGKEGSRTHKGAPLPAGQYVCKVTRALLSAAVPTTLTTHSFHCTPASALRKTGPTVAPYELASVPAEHVLLRYPTNSSTGNG